jgi:peptidyl-prolyl cis-trans isomerase-like 4
VQQDFAAQTGDPTGTGDGGCSIYGLVSGKPEDRFFADELRPTLRHDRIGVVSMANRGPHTRTNGSQFLITTREHCVSLDDKNTVFGEVAEGLDTLQRINAAFCDDKGRPYADIRIRHTHVLVDPFEPEEGVEDAFAAAVRRLEPPSSPLHIRPPAETVPERLDAEEAAAAEAALPFVDPAKAAALDRDLAEALAEKEARAHATVLEMVGDLPSADVAPPDTVLFVCKLNPVTRDGDLELIFSRFGTVTSCDIVRDRSTGQSLGYAFVAFETPAQCEDAYGRMDGVVIDDRRIKVDFSQSVAHLWKQFKQKGKRQQVEPKPGQGRQYRGPAAGGGGSGSGPNPRPPVAAVAAAPVAAAAGSATNGAPVNIDPAAKERLEALVAKINASKGQQPVSTAPAISAKWDRPSHSAVATAVPVASTAPAATHSSRGADTAEAGKTSRVAEPTRDKAVDGDRRTHRDRDRERDRHRDRERDRVGDRDRDREQYRDRDMDRERERDRDRERERERERDREQDRHRDRDRDRDRERNRDRGRDRRRSRSRSIDGDRSRHNDGRRDRSGSRY